MEEKLRRYTKASTSVGFGFNGGKTLTVYQSVQVRLTRRWSYGGARGGAHEGLTALV
ncbi:hypothetical protein ERO13_A08G041700v2 [Gossypium hirsutum]|nr:hypothetical protein ERO13_A08G041700v2 [Gossypium hirsutum]